MRVGWQSGSNRPTRSDASKAWEAAGLAEVAVALAWAVQQRSHGEVPWFVFHDPDIGLPADTHDNQAALPHRARARSHRARGGVFPHRGDALQDSARFHPVAAQSLSRRTFLLVGSAPTLVVRRSQQGRDREDDPDWQK